MAFVETRVQIQQNSKLILSSDHGLLYKSLMYEYHNPNVYWYLVMCAITRKSLDAFELDETSRCTKLLKTRYRTKKSSRPQNAEDTLTESITSGSHNL